MTSRNSKTARSCGQTEDNKMKEIIEALIKYLTFGG